MGIKDGDKVRVFNDIGEMFAMAKLHPGTPVNLIWTEMHGRTSSSKTERGLTMLLQAYLRRWSLLEIMRT